MWLGAEGASSAPTSLWIPWQDLTLDRQRTYNPKTGELGKPQLMKYRSASDLLGNVLTEYPLS